ncbi:MAG: 50S ribosomal protein L37e [Candidatus Syntrophoarchaeum sp.]|nr:50S ribosomal protein L37e [Candidatus Syntrophoarchaeum sp.]
MSKGTPSMGKRQKKSHIRCRRCGNNSFNVHRKVCASCGFGKSRRLKSNQWQVKRVKWNV